MPRLRAAFRVGVTGQAHIDPSQHDRLRSEVSEVLAFVRDQVTAALATDAARPVYTGDPPMLRLVSPLGEGADRIVAQEALKLGFALEVPMPFEQAAYEGTFGDDNDPASQAASIAEFRELLAQAEGRVLSIDGDASDAVRRPHSYEAVGRVVVRNVDLLIAVWDNERPARGRGGTTDTVHYALHAGVPTWWLNPTRAQEPTLLWNLTDIPNVGVARDRPPAREGLAAYISLAVVPPTTHKAVEQAPHGGVARLPGAGDAHAPDPLRAYLGETAKPNRNYWRLHSATLANLARLGAFTRKVLHAESDPPAPAPSARSSAPKSFLQRVFSIFAYDTRIDPSSTPAHLAGIYQQRYRTSYFLVFVFASLTLISLILGLTVEAWEAPATICEFIFLAAVFLIVFWNEHARWYERYISYRLLGELTRMSQYLHRIAWALPGSRVSTVTGHQRHNWVPWTFAAGVRATPLTTGSLSSRALESVKQAILEQLVEGQKRYHRKRAKDDDDIGWLLGGLARWFFLLTFAFAAIRVAILPFLGEAVSVDTVHAGGEGSVAGHGMDALHWVAKLLTVLSGVIPAMGIAFFALRAYEQLDVLSQQSRQMIAALETAEERIRRIDTDRPLATELLGTELSELATLMLHDVGGWAQLFQMKAVEA